jgi:hypothetical protein
MLSGKVHIVLTSLVDSLRLHHLNFTTALAAVLLSLSRSATKDWFQFDVKKQRWGISKTLIKQKASARLDGHCIYNLGLDTYDQAHTSDDTPNVAAF